MTGWGEGISDEFDGFSKKDNEVSNRHDQESQ